MNKSQREETAAKSAYRRPELTRYGTVTELTLHIGGKAIDAEAGTRKFSGSA